MYNDGRRLEMLLLEDAKDAQIAELQESMSTKDATIDSLESQLENKNRQLLGGQEQASLQKGATQPHHVVLGR